MLKHSEKLTFIINSFINNDKDIILSFSNYPNFNLSQYSNLKDRQSLHLAFLDIFKSKKNFIAFFANSENKIVAYLESADIYSKSTKSRDTLKEEALTKKLLNYIEKNKNDFYEIKQHDEFCYNYKDSFFIKNNVDSFKFCNPIDVSLKKDSFENTYSYKITFRGLWFDLYIPITADLHFLKENFSVLNLNQTAADFKGTIQKRIDTVSSQINEHQQKLDDLKKEKQSLIDLQNNTEIDTMLKDVFGKDTVNSKCLLRVIKKF